MHIRCALSFLLGLGGGRLEEFFFWAGVCPKGNISETCLGFYVGECRMFQRNWWWTNQWSSFFSKLIKKKLWVQPHFLLCFALIRWCAFQVLFFLQWANLIGPSLKKKKLWRLPKIEGSIFKYSVPPHWPTYIGERWTKFAKANGIKVSAIGNSFGNMLGIEELFALTPHHCHQ
jgi:hypothetical protein